MQSLIFDFKKSPTFFKKWNKEFDVEDIISDSDTINADFNIVIVDDVCDDNIEDCIDSNGELVYSSPHILSKTCALDYKEEGLERCYISLNQDVTFDFEELSVENFSLKGAFLTTEGGYVLGYSINQYSLNVTYQMIFEEGLIFFDIIEGVVND